jgi:excisionase family DNA binding protein
MSEKILVSIPEAGETIGHKRSFIYALIRAGKIEAKKSGKRRLVVVASLKTYVDSLPSSKA